MNGLRDLPQNDYYMGGVGNGLGLQEKHIRALRELDFDLPDVAEDDGDVDAGPSLWVDGFSDDEEEEINASL
ncbi:hypothetical protein JVU11DRAFT_3121 [Chiua virens]|nr:hypothetical protein JVU11DRAFT_3121 [Chiua virens]